MFELRDLLGEETQDVGLPVEVGEVTDSHVEHFPRGLLLLLFDV